MQQMTMFGLNQPELNKPSTKRKGSFESDHDYLESIGQMNIFDYTDVGQDSKRTRRLVEGDKVKLRFYVDEIEYIRLCHPQMMGEGIVTEWFDNHCMVSIAGELIKVDNEKLLLLSVEG